MEWAATLINRIDARDCDDDHYLQDFYLAGRGDNERAEKIVRSVFAQDFDAGLSLYRDSAADPWAVRLNRLVLNEAARLVNENSKTLDDARFPVYFDIVRQADWREYGNSVVGGFAACLRSPKVREEQRFEMFVRLQVIEQDDDMDRREQQYAAYRLLEQYGQLTPKLGRGAFRKSLATAPALIEDIALDDAPRGAMVRNRSDGSIYISLGKAGVDFPSVNGTSRGQVAFRLVMAGDENDDATIFHTRWVEPAERFDIILNDEQNGRRADTMNPLEWGDIGGWIFDDFMEYKDGKISGVTMAESLSTDINNLRSGRNFDLLVTISGEHRRYPLKYYRADNVWDGGEKKIEMVCEVTDKDNAIFAPYEIEAITIGRESVLESGYGKQIDDVEETMYVRMLQAGLMSDELIQKRPDLVMRYGL